MGNNTKTVGNRGYQQGLPTGVTQRIFNHEIANVLSVENIFKLIKVILHFAVILYS